MSTDHIEPPRYRVIAEGVFISGALRKVGSEHEFSGWPLADKMVPLNESARRIQAYHRRFHTDPFCPKSPWLAEHACFYLPGTLARMSPGHAHPVRVGWAWVELPSPVPAADVVDGMPIYRVRERQMPPLRRGEPPYVRTIKQVGRHRLQQPDEAFAHLAWPGPDFAAANEAAETGRRVLRRRTRTTAACCRRPGACCGKPCSCRSLQQVQRREEGSAPVQPSASHVALHVGKGMNCRHMPTLSTSTCSRTSCDGINRAKPLPS